MGFSPLSGLVMSTRSGNLDPGVLLYLLEERHMTPRALRALVSAQAGLLGVSGISPDMRDLLAAEARGDERAALALDLFCYEARKALGGLVAVLGGLDTLVFTGGIGEHAAAIRAETLAQLAILGPVIDPARNATHGAGAGGRITADGSRLLALVIATNEELMIARETARVLDLR
jgi:acetate kinase